MAHDPVLARKVSLMVQVEYLRWLRRELEATHDHFARYRDLVAIDVEERLVLARLWKLVESA